MTYLEGIALAVIQGLTEYLPISSSAHLILLSEFMGSNQNLFYDVSLHLGTLMAVCIYFRTDLIEIINNLDEKLIIKWIGYNPSDKTINEIKYNFSDLLKRKLNDKQRI